jgi:hypothetical protein
MQEGASQLAVNELKQVQVQWMGIGLPAPHPQLQDPGFSAMSLQL